MPPRAPELIVALACITAGGGCTAGPPAPTPIDEGQPAVRRPRRRADQPEVSPRSPQVLAPEREGEQLPPDEIEAVLADAERFLAQGRRSVATVYLRKCANRRPPDARCDGRLGVLLADDQKHRAEALYLLEEVVDTRDDRVTPALLDDVAEQLRRLAKYELSARARRRAIELEDTADRHAELSHALVAMDDQFETAIEELKVAYEMDPSRHEWLLERATLMSQRPPMLGASIELMRDYLEKTRGEQPARDEQLERRITNLETRLDALEKARANNAKARRHGDDATAGGSD